MTIDELRAYYAANNALPDNMTPDDMAIARSYMEQQARARQVKNKGLGPRGTGASQMEMFGPQGGVVRQPRVPARTPTAPTQQQDLGLRPAPVTGPGITEPNLIDVETKLLKSGKAHDDVYTQRFARGNNPLDQGSRTVITEPATQRPGVIDRLKAGLNHDPWMPEQSPFKAYGGNEMEIPERPGLSAVQRGELRTAREQTAEAMVRKQNFQRELASLRSADTPNNTRIKALEDSLKTANADIKAGRQLEAEVLQARRTKKGLTDTVTDAVSSKAGAQEAARNLGKGTEQVVRETGDKLKSAYDSAKVKLEDARKLMEDAAPDMKQNAMQEYDKRLKKFQKASRKYQQSIVSTGEEAISKIQEVVSPKNRKGAVQKLKSMFNLGGSTKGSLNADPADPTGDLKAAKVTEEVLPENTPNRKQKAQKPARLKKLGIGLGIAGVFDMVANVSKDMSRYGAEKAWELNKNDFIAMAQDVASRYEKTDGNPAKIAGATLSLLWDAGVIGTIAMVENLGKHAANIGLDIAEGMDIWDIPQIRLKTGRDATAEMFDWTNADEWEPADVFSHYDGTGQEAIERTKPTPNVMKMPSITGGDTYTGEAEKRLGLSTPPELFTQTPGATQPAPAPAPAPAPVSRMGLDGTIDLSLPEANQQSRVEIAQRGNTGLFDVTGANGAGGFGVIDATNAVGGPTGFRDRVKQSMREGAYSPVTPARVEEQRQANQQVNRGLDAMRQLSATRLGVPVQYLDAVRGGTMSRERANLLGARDNGLAADNAAAMMNARTNAARGLRDAQTEATERNFTAFDRGADKYGSMVDPENPTRGAGEWRSFAASWMGDVNAGNLQPHQIEDVTGELELRKALKRGATGWVDRIFGNDTSIAGMTTNPQESVLNTIIPRDGRDWFWNDDNMSFTIMNDDGSQETVSLDVNDNMRDDVANYIARRVPGGLRGP